MAAKPGRIHFPSQIHPRWTDDRELDNPIRSLPSRSMTRGPSLSEGASRKLSSSCLGRGQQNESSSETEEAEARPLGKGIGSLLSTKAFLFV